MDISTFTLFVSCLLFAGVNFLVNVNTRSSRGLKFFTYVLGIAGVVIAGYLIGYSFIIRF